MNQPFRTITNKFDSICRRCGDMIPAGQKVRWGKGKGVYHFADVCSGADPERVSAAFAAYNGNS
jgi:hypothetical protein